jgi:thiosulfate dehydrogenase [quinone] large subunit
MRSIGVPAAALSSPAMQRPDAWIVLLRIVVALWFLKAVWTKFTLVDVGFASYPVVAPRFLGFQPRRVAEFAAGNPITWYREFLEGVVLPNAAVFATLQAWGELLVGLGLLLGVLTRAAALGGLFLTVNYGLATQWMSFGQQGFHLLLLTSMMIFLGAGAGRRWGLDAWLLVRGSGERRWLRVLA